MFSKIKETWYAPHGYKSILKVGLPLVASMLSTALMQFTDRLFLSHYSIDAIAAALPAAMANMTILFLLMGTVGYTTVIIAQYIGSGAAHRVGPAIWQGVWGAIGGGVIIAGFYFLAVPIFAIAGHEPQVQHLEVIYFRVLCIGSVMGLLNMVMGCFFTGRGQTRPVLVANLFATVVKVPLDYTLIFGLGPIPSLGIAGAAIATTMAWSVSAIILGSLVFSKKYEKVYKVRSGWRFQPGMFMRMLRFGLPSGFNMLMDTFVIFWFSMQVGELGKVALAASNIALTLNNPIFLPMLGLNLAAATLVGQAMGAGKTDLAAAITTRTLHMAFAYMIPMAFLLVTLAGPLMDLFTPGDIPPELAIPVRQTGVYLLYYVAIYSLVDAASIIYFGGLKGAGDTKGVFYMLITGAVFFFLIPISVVQHLGCQSIHSYWIIFTVYVVFLAFAATLRFRQGKWRKIRVVETATQ